MHSAGDARNLPLTDIRTFDTDTKIVDFHGTAVHDEQRERDGAFFQGAWGNFGVQGEWARVDFTSLDLATGARSTVFCWAWFLDVVWVLTGENKVFNRRMVPREPLFEGGAGAWEVAVRVGQWFADERMLFLLVPGAPFLDEISNLTVGVNWYPDANVRVSMNVLINQFDDSVMIAGRRISQEYGLLFRFQFGT